MIRRLLFGTVILSAAAVSAPMAGAAPTIGVRCGANEDRVWVYESLVDFNVEAKLKCGDQVEILDRVKGYVKVRTAGGDEGFVAATAFPKSAIPPEPEDHSHDLQAVSQQMLANQRNNPAPSVEKSSFASAPSATASTISSAPAPVATPAPRPSPAPVVVAAAKPTPAPAPQPIAQPTPVATPTPATVAVSTPASTPAPAPQPVTQPVLVAAATPAPQPAPQPVPASRPAPPTVTPKPAASPAPAPVAQPTPAIAAKSTPASAPAAREMEVTLTTATPAPQPQPAPVPQPQPVAASAPSVAYAAPAPKPAPVAAKPPVDPDTEEETYAPAVESTANCNSFFVAYGLSPNQYKWIQQNRKKAFPTVCPAPTQSQVDYIVIFTHDVDFYSVTMPTQVHHEAGGFSDWAPLETVDDAVMSPSDANKAHHEYVFVFHARRGTYDPAAFSSRRKPLFSKDETNMLGSHGGFRTVMDALTWIETTGASRESAQQR